MLRYHKSPTQVWQQQRPKISFLVTPVKCEWKLSQLKKSSYCADGILLGRGWEVKSFHIMSCHPPLNTSTLCIGFPGTYSSSRIGQRIHSCHVHYFMGSIALFHDLKLFLIWQEILEHISEAHIFLENNLQNDYFMSRQILPKNP